jgi:hypothetical protein
MQDLCGMVFQSSEQHKEISKTRQERDTKEITRQRNPFASQPLELRSISTGLIACDNVDVDQAQIIGEKILASMDGKEVESYTFRRSDQATTMATKANRRKDTAPTIQPELMFQQYMIGAQSRESPAEAFRYELCSFPTSLFEPKKAVLADAMWNKFQSSTTTFDDTLNTRHDSLSLIVLDGGSLLHWVLWKPNMTYTDIAPAYIDFVRRNYGLERTHVVFDGYSEGPSNKDQGSKLAVSQYPCDTKSLC